MRRFDPMDDEAPPVRSLTATASRWAKAASLLLLESASAAAARGARIYGEILGVGAAASKRVVNGWPADSSGLVKAMRLALSDGQLGAGR